MKERLSPNYLMSKKKVYILLSISFQFYLYVCMRMKQEVKCSKPDHHILWNKVKKKVYLIWFLYLLSLFTYCSWHPIVKYRIEWEKDSNNIPRLINNIACRSEVSIAK